MALTLIEAAKLETGDVYRSGVIELYAGSSDILMALPFENITGGSLAYNRETALPGIGFRGVNESYTPSTGITRFTKVSKSFCLQISDYSPM